MGGGIPKPAQSSEAVDHVSKGARKDGRNGEGPGINLQGGGAVGDIIFQQEMVGDRVDAQVPDGVPPSGSTAHHMDYSESQSGGEWEYPYVEESMAGDAADHMDYGESRVRRRVGVPICRGGNGSRRDQPHRDVLDRRQTIIADRAT